MLKRWGRSSGVLFRVKNGAVTTSRKARPTPTTNELISKGSGWRNNIWPAPAAPMSKLEKIRMILPLKRSMHTPAGKMVSPAPIVPTNNTIPTKSA